MPTIQQISTYSQTAIAAYGLELIPLQDNSSLYKAQAVGMADAQAVTFNKEWAVLQQSTPNGNGFSAVLLQRKDAAGNATGEKILSIAGTDPSSPADLITDLVNIAQYGTVLNMPQYASLDSFYAELVSSGKLGTGEQVTVTGHSLGGFLAQAFTARHANVVSATYTYNAPGFGSPELLLGFLAVTDTAAAVAKSTNVHATDGLSMTAGLGVMLGASQPARIEADTNPLNNHSVVRLGDALAIYDTYARLQPNIGMDQASVLWVASGRGDRRQEDALDALRTAFIGSASNDSNQTPTGNREVFYANLYQLQNNPNFMALSGQVRLARVDPGFASAAQAATNTALAYRYALVELLPYAVLANTDAQNQTLYGNYTQRLSLYDATTGQGELTQSWITDRATLLTAITAHNTKDGDGVAYSSAFPTDRAYDLHWIDASGSEQILIAENTARQGGVLRPVALQRFSFGSDGNDLLIGTDNRLEDHLYGGAGADTLDGQGGNDYLEGNSGDDTLIGGAGSDQLLGGTGTDTYQFTTGFGVDTILDSDGLGKIQIGASLILSGGQETAAGSGLWLSTDKRYRYTLTTETTETTETTTGQTLTPWSAVAGLHSRLGVDVNIAIENPWLSDEPRPTTGTWNHSQMVLADSLAVYALLAQMDPTLSGANTFAFRNAA